MNHNKSEIMRAAWELYRTGRFKSFSYALRNVWFDSKCVVSARLNGLITYSEVNIGDTLTFEYGDHDNWVTGTVESIQAFDRIPGYYVIKCGQYIEICVRMNDTVKRVAVAKNIKAA